MRAWWLVGVVAAWGTVSAAPFATTCELRGHAARLVTPSGAAIPVDGGIVVAWEPIIDVSATGERPVPSRVARTPVAAWSVRDARGAEVAVTPHELAPGLTVYRAPAGYRGVVTFVAEQRALGSFTLGIDPRGRASSAPRVTALHELADRRAATPREPTTIEAELAGPPPAAAVAVLLVTARGPAYAPVTPTSARRLPVFAEPVPCSDAPRAASLLGLGDPAQLLWVDEFGRTTAPSAAVRLRE